MAITIPSHPIADKVEPSHSTPRSNIVLVTSIFKNVASPTQRSFTSAAATGAGGLGSGMSPGPFRMYQLLANACNASSRVGP
jgi:hypothetical protein